MSGNALTIKMVLVPLTNAQKKKKCIALLERKNNMYEFHIRNTHTGEKKILFGYTANDAFRRANIVNTELWNWEIEFSEYVD